MDTSRLLAFVATAEAGSLSSAARRLGVQLSTISRQLRDLEEEVGTALLTRTGRGVRLTDAGERFLGRARHVLRELDAAVAEAQGARESPIAQLRLSAPLELSLRLLPGVLASLLEQTPGLSIDVRSEPRRVSLLEEDIDAAIRLGPLRDSGLIARALGSISLGLWARPEVAGTRTARSPGPFVVVAGSRTELPATLRGRPFPLRIDGPLRVGSFTEAAEIALRSDHTVLLPSFTARDYLLAGHLAPVLQGLVLPPVEVHLVHTQRLRGSSLISCLTTLLTRALSKVELALRPRVKARS
ncbi:MAG: LysR family transcriptional regulator [Polyangiaceae bacterium]|nr:LysR family transcriptional regulator [Polyangiaceae bacterium]